jgi:hypothetical protein
LARKLLQTCKPIAVAGQAGAEADIDVKETK